MSVTLISFLFLSYRILKIILKLNSIYFQTFLRLRILIFVLLINLNFSLLLSNCQLPKKHILTGKWNRKCFTFLNSLALPARHLTTKQRGSNFANGATSHILQIPITENISFFVVIYSIKLKVKFNLSDIKYRYTKRGCLTLL